MFEGEFLLLRRQHNTSPYIEKVIYSKNIQRKLQKKHKRAPFIGNGLSIVLMSFVAERTNFLQKRPPNDAKIVLQIVWFEMKTLLNWFCRNLDYSRVYNQNIYVYQGWRYVEKV